MKKLLVIVIIFVIQQCYALDIQKIKQIHVIKFDNKEFNLTNSNDSTSLFLHEFIRKGDSFSNKHWKESFEVNVYKNQTASPVQLALNVASFINSNSKFPRNFKITICNTGNKEYDTSQALLDFLTWPNNVSKNKTFMEFNIFYYFYGEDRNNIIGLHYVRRFYPPNLSGKVHAWFAEDASRIKKTLWQGNISTGKNISVAKVFKHQVPTCKKLGYIDLHSLKSFKIR